MALPIRQSIDALRGIRSEPKRVLAMVCELFENGGRKACWATNAEFGTKLGMRPDSVSALLAGLHSRGLVVVKVLHKQGNRRTLTPTAACRALYDSTETAAPWSPPIPTSGASQDSPLSPEVGVALGESRDSLSAEVGTPSPQKSGELSTTNDEQETNNNDQTAADAARFAAEVERLSKELTAERERTAALLAELEAIRLAPPVAPPPRSRKIKAPAEAEPDGFAIWYGAYPRKENRKAAADAFGRLSAADRQAAIDGLNGGKWFDRRTDWWGRNNEDYRPHPASWLNARRWEDAPPAAPTVSNPANPQANALHRHGTLATQQRLNAPVVTAETGYGSFADRFPPTVT